jgi:hypothetical protein
MDQDQISLIPAYPALRAAGWKFGSITIQQYNQTECIK